MAMYGISHTINTKVGNDFERGVSGGERKRVTIAEATLSGAPFQCWDKYVQIAPFSCSGVADEEIQLDTWS